MEPVKRFLFWLLDGTRGAPTRMRLLALLSQKPLNLHQLAIASALDYSTVEHHIRLMEKHGIVDCMGEGYGRLYFVSEIPYVQQFVAQKLKGDTDENKGKPKGRQA
ncbi:MAG: winged helix-turn-helix transcriptional regulator [Candidatus Micrarchaeota archaeon]|nr:winged helix-turn-helix transcriptional regulator [Candidatus Micrarchaeota archaeon]